MLLVMVLCATVLLVGTGQAAPLRGRLPIRGTQMLADRNTTASVPAVPAITTTSDNYKPLPKIYPGMIAYSTKEEAQLHDSKRQAHKMLHVDGTVYWMAGEEHPKYMSKAAVPVPVDKQSVEVALAVNAAIEQLNEERSLLGWSKVRVVNILSAKKIVGDPGERRIAQYTIKVQLRKKGGRFEFQQLNIDEVQQQSPTYPLRHPPQVLPETTNTPVTISPTSEAILTPPLLTNYATKGKSNIYKLAGHKIVRSSLSAPRHQAKMVLVPAGKVVAASTLMKSMAASASAPATPPATPPPPPAAATPPPAATPPAATAS